MKVEDVFSKLRVLLSGVPEGSILGTILFNIFLNNLLFYLKNLKVCNFVNNNMISAISRNKTLEQGTSLGVEWFGKNNMIVNLDKFQAMLFQKGSKLCKITRNYNWRLAKFWWAFFKPSKNLNAHCVKSVQIRSFFWSIFSCIRTEYGGSRSKSLYSVLIRENTDQKKLGVWTLFTRWKLNALNRMKVYIGKKEMEILINSFVYSNLNYCFLVLHFTSCKSTKKIEKIHQSWRHNGDTTTKDLINLKFQYC